MEFIETEDGSFTIHDQESGELHHNRAGAYLEALQNYCLPADLSRRMAGRKELRMLDACFGLGYNSWVLLQEIIVSELDLESVSIVALEIDEKVIAAIPTVLDQPCFRLLREHLNRGMSAPRNFGKHLFRVNNVQVSLDIRQVDLRLELPKLLDAEERFDLVFHDPFSPSRVPELWSIELFEIYKNLLSADVGAVFTYSAAGSVRGALSELGYFVYRTTALGAKKGGTCGSMKLLDCNSHLMELSERELIKMRGIGGIPFRDESMRSSRQDIVDRRLTEQSQLAAVRLTNSG